MRNPNILLTCAVLWATASCILAEAAARASFNVEVVTAGTKGPEIAIGDTVSVTYRTELAGGVELASYGSAEAPYTFMVGNDRLLEGWNRSFPGRRTGDHLCVTVPPKLGYGDQGTVLVPPAATLIFDIKILAVDHIDAKDWKSEPSGLRYVDIDRGDTEQLAVAVGTKVEVHYTGTIKGGKKFDSSRDRGQPFKFTAGQKGLIEGWNQGVLGMHAGGHRRLEIPPGLGYGSRAASGGTIPADSTLEYDIEVLSVSEGDPDSPTYLDPKKLHTTGSGLQYVVLREGNGRTPTRGERILARYAGCLENGREFGSSDADGQPLSVVLGVGQLVPGWEEALALMNVGSQLRLRIPAGLAYGSRGRSPDIPPNSTLYFDIDLLRILE